MKQKLLTTACLALLCVVSSSCRQHDYREIVMDVPEMKNDACVRIIAKSFVRAPGLNPESIRYDVPSRTIRMTYDSLLIAEKNIEFFVAKAGFSANSIPANAKAAAALPPECKR